MKSTQTIETDKKDGHTITLVIPPDVKATITYEIEERLKGRNGDSL